MASTLAIGSFMPIIGLIALPKILVSCDNVAFVRSFLVVSVLLVVVYFGRAITAPVHRFLGVWQRTLSAAPGRV